MITLPHNSGPVPRPTGSPGGLVAPETDRTESPGFALLLAQALPSPANPPSGVVRKAPSEAEGVGAWGPAPGGTLTVDRDPASLAGHAAQRVAELVLVNALRALGLPAPHATVARAAGEAWPSPDTLNAVQAPGERVEPGSAMARDPAPGAHTAEPADLDAPTPLDIRPRTSASAEPTARTTRISSAVAGAAPEASPSPGCAAAPTPDPLPDGVRLTSAAPGATGTALTDGQQPARRRVPTDPAAQGAPATTPEPAGQPSMLTVANPVHSPMSAAHSPAAERSGGPSQLDDVPAPRLPPAAPAPRSDRVTIHFSGEHGFEGSVRVAIRGRTIHATIMSADADQARRLGEHLGALRRTLEGQGFPDTRLTIHWGRTGESGSASGTRDPRDGTPADHRPSYYQRHEDTAGHARRDPRRHPDDREETP